MLKHVDNKVVIRIDIENKNSHRFSDGTTIRIERQYNNLNRRETEPVNAWVVSAENIKEGSEILIHPNAVTESYRIYNYAPLSGEEIAGQWKYYGIPEEMCYLYREGERWLPLKGYVVGQRVFEPYKGIIEGIEPTQIKNVLYIETGELAGKVVQTLKACDYEIIFQGTNGQEQRIIRCRYFPNDPDNERQEVIAIRHDLTERVNDGSLYLGLNATNAKPHNEYLCQTN